MTDSEKPETPAAGPETSAPETAPVAKAPDAQASEAAAPVGEVSATPKAPEAPPPPARGGRENKGPKKPMGMPRRRILDPLPSQEEMDRFTSGPRMKDLDDEIESELEAAMSGFSGKELLIAEKAESGPKQEGGAPKRKQAKVLSVRGADVFVDIPGGRSQGVMSALQFPEGPPEPGTIVEVDIEGYDPANGLVICTRLGATVIADWSTVAPGMVVEARVLETNKGGLAVDVNGIRGFMPISQIDLYRVEQTEQFVNQKLRCVVMEVSPEERNLVVSRRDLLEKEREEQKEKTWAELAEGQIRDGIVRSVRDFGAFVDIGGVDGLLHVSEMSWQRVSDPTKLLQPGQAVKVQVLKIDREKKKVGLGLKQLQASPWDNMAERFHTGQTVNGTVTRTMDFGAFVELEPGLEGLVHISELARQRTWRVTDIVKPGQEVTVKVLSIDPEQRRISLSLKEMIPIEKPKSDEDEEEEIGEIQPIRPSNVPLRGGVGHDRWIALPEKEEE